MVKFVFLIPRRNDLSRDDFNRQWRDVCVPLVRKLPGLRSYIISPVLEQPGSANPTYDGVAELWFDDAKAGQKALGSTEGQAVVNDMPNFADMKKFVVLVTEEQVIVPAQKGARA